MDPRRLQFLVTHPHQAGNSNLRTRRSCTKIGFYCKCHRCWRRRLTKAWTLPYLLFLLQITLTYAESVEGVEIKIKTGEAGSN